MTWISGTGREHPVEIFTTNYDLLFEQALERTHVPFFDGLPLEPFTVHDLRRTGSTLLNEIGFNRDWIEKCLAHEDGRSSRSIYNKAEYADQRCHMLQEWANMVDAWIDGQDLCAEADAGERGGAGATCDRVRGGWHGDPGTWCCRWTEGGLPLS